MLDSLTREGGSLALDAQSSQWRARFDEVWSKAPRVPRTLQGELRDYQLEGFRWLARLADLGLGACLADDLGLGKTVQLVALLLHRSASGPALVVAPTSVCENWRRELERFAPSLAVRVAGPDRAELLEGLAKRVVVVTSYTLLQQDADALQSLVWSTVVLDEAQLPSSKLESFMELVEELVAGRHRVLVFSQFTDVLALVRPLREAKSIAYQYLDGLLEAG